MVDKKLKGVNLGGWLLLEKWMTPSLFINTDAQDEYSLSLQSNGAEKIKRHRESFITETDFEWMETHGINAVRIPVGYWVLHADAPFVDAVSKLDWAMDMAKKYHLQVIIDLHGLKGSQNGYDHSGRAGKSHWHKSAEYRRESLTTLEQIAERYKDYDNLWGLQIINEPKIGLFQIKLRHFYKEAYRCLDRILKPHTRIIFSDAFTPRLLSGALGRHNSRVVMDVHLYHMTTLLSQFLSVDWFIGKTIRRGRLLKRLSETQPVIIGEWSGVIRHETMRRLSQDNQEILIRDYTKLQMEIYQNIEGWFYWSYKTESPGVWNFRTGVESGQICLIR